MLQQAMAGMHVIEVATYIPGPVCTQILAGLGARVTKVSRPGGDPLRDLVPLDAAYDLFNQGKEELELDLRTAGDAERLRALVRGADVLVDGLRPGALARMGLGPDELHQLNPRLVYCALSGFGLDSSAGSRAGHDLDFVALSGLLATTTSAGQPALPGTQLADLVSGLMAATAILAALLARGADEPGGTLDAPMLGATRWLMAPWYVIEQSRPEARLLTGERAYYNVYATADGRHLAVAALEAHFWERFCAVLGRPDLAARQHDTDQATLRGEVATLVASRTLAQWQAALEGVDACVSPVLNLAEAAAVAPASMRLPVHSR